MTSQDYDIIKDIPGYKMILKAVLKSQIQQLVSFVLLFGYIDRKKANFYSTVHGIFSVICSFFLFHSGNGSFIYPIGNIFSNCCEMCQLGIFVLWNEASWEVYNYYICKYWPLEIILLSLIELCINFLV